jgi:hypothetical protein
MLVASASFRKVSACGFHCSDLPSRIAITPR